MVRGRFELPGGPREIEVQVREARRSALLDGKPARDPDETVGGLPVVSFTPDDLALVKGGPEGRRRTIDRAAQNRHPTHRADARDYLRALRSRNELLRRGAPPQLRQAFDGPLARAGARLRLRREQVLEEALPMAQTAFAEVVRGEEPLRIEYLAAGRGEVSSPAAGGDRAQALEAWLRAALDARFERDRERGFTSVGPHADDVFFGIGERAARLYASQGQSRAIVLALKIGEIENLRQRQGCAPLLLLDDVSSELDPERNKLLLQHLAKLAGQVVLTTTDPRVVASAADLSHPAEARFYAVRAGAIDPA